MSTKSTIAYGNNFHFYHEVCDDNHVYLELEGMEFEAGYGRVMVSIPIHIWEVIRHLGEARLDLVNHTDEDLLKMVEEDVDGRIAEFEEAAMRIDPKSNQPRDISELNVLIREIVTHWKEIARRNFYKAHPGSTPSEFEQVWPKALANFFLSETIRVANALRSLSEGRGN